MTGDSPQAASTEELQLQLQWESVRMGLGWCFFGSLAGSAAIMVYLTGLALSFQVANDPIGAVRLGFPLETIRDGTMVTAGGAAMAAVLGLVFGMALCCSGPPNFPGRVLPAMSLGMLLLGCMENIRSLVSMMAFARGGFRPNPIEEMAVFSGMGFTLFLYLSAACLMGYVLTVATARGAVGLVGQIRALMAGSMVMILVGIGGMVVLTMLGPPELGGLGQLVVIVVCLALVVILAVGVAMCDKILYQAWRLIPPLTPVKRQGPFPSPPHPFDPTAAAPAPEKPPQKHPLD